MPYSDVPRSVTSTICYSTYTFISTVITAIAAFGRLLQYKYSNCRRLGMDLLCAIYCNGCDCNCVATRWCSGCKLHVCNCCWVRVFAAGQARKHMWETSVCLVGVVNSLSAVCFRILRGFSYLTAAFVKVFNRTILHVVCKFKRCYPEHLP